MRRELRTTPRGEVQAWVPYTVLSGIPGGIVDDGPGWVLLGTVHEERDGLWSCLAVGERDRTERRKYKSKRAAMHAVFEGIPDGLGWSSLQAIRDAWAAVDRCG